MLGLNLDSKHPSLELQILQYATRWDPQATLHSPTVWMVEVSIGFERGPMMVQGLFSMVRVWKLKAEASCKANVGGNPNPPPKNFTGPGAS